jgi:hypothetical protein
MHSVSYHTAKIDSLRWTPHLSECLEVLSTQPEWTGDRTLAKLVRMQLVIERMVLAGWYHEFMDEANPRLPPSAYLHTSHAELASIRAQFTPDEDAASSSSYYSTT